MPSPMAMVAEQLRRGREAQKLDIYQVAEITKIKTEHLRALEAGDYDAFAAPVYIRGFIRTYAKVLKLDVPRLLLDLDVELSQTTNFRNPPPLTDSKHHWFDFLTFQLSKLNLRVAAVCAAIVVAAVLAWLAVQSWQTGREADPLRGLDPGLYQPTDRQSGELLPLPPVEPIR